MGTYFKFLCTFPQKLPQTKFLFKRKLFIEALTPTCSLGDSTCKNFKNKMDMSNPMIAPPLFPSHQFMPYMYACLLSMYIHVCMFVQWIYTSHGMYKHLGKRLTHRSTEVACLYSLIRCLSLLLRVPRHLQITTVWVYAVKAVHAMHGCILYTQRAFLYAY